MRAASTYSGGTAPASTGFPVMPSWAPKAPIQFSNYLRLLQPPRAGGVKRLEQPGANAERKSPAAEVEAALRNMVDAARVFRERLAHSGS